MKEQCTETITCVICPVGCSITVAYEKDGTDTRVTGVTGNRCERGHNYASHEVTAPERILTTSVPGKYPDDDRIYRVPVKSRTPIPKSKMMDILDKLKAVSKESPLVLPVRMGDMVLADAEGTGVDIIVTRSV